MPRAMESPFGVNVKPDYEAFLPCIRPVPRCTIPSMRPLAFLLLLALTAHPAPAAEPPAAPTWPLWDGQESVEQYGKRAGLEANKTLDLGNGIKMEMVLVPAGKFVMGTEEPESPWIGGAVLAVGGLVALVLIAVPLVRALRQRRRPQFSLRWLILLVMALGVGQYGGFRWWRAAEAWKSFGSDESPAHQVIIRRPFYMGRFEVTQEQYQEIARKNRSEFTGQDLPVEGVPWDEAQEFCEKASQRTRQPIRLPSEAEWEYACRAGTTTRFCCGDANADLESVAWFGANSGGRTHPVGRKKPNFWGLYDMHGNACEWCEDWYGPYQAEAQVDPRGPGEGEYRVSRGGDWSWRSMDPNSCRSAIRLRRFPEGGLNLGFRVVVDVPPRAP